MAARGWFVRALNNEPALMFSAIFGFGILVVPLAGQLSGLVQTELDDDCAYGHRYEERVGNPGFDADKFMQFYSGKNAYRSFGPPENSNVETEPISRHDWLMETGYTVTAAKPWVLPDLGYTQSRQRVLPEEEAEEEAAPEAGRT